MMFLAKVRDVALLFMSLEAIKALERCIYVDVFHFLSSNMLKE